MINRIILLLICCIAPSLLWAQPVCITDIITTKQPAARAKLTKLLFKIYDIELWHDHKEWEPQQAYALHIIYYQNVSKQEFVDYTIKELKLNPDVTPEMITQFERKLSFIYPDVKKMDSLTAVNVPGEGVLLCHNENKLGWMREEALVLPFFNIWLGRHSSEPVIRNTLLKPRN